MVNENTAQSAPELLRFDRIESRLYEAASWRDLLDDSAFKQQLFHRLDQLIPRKGILSVDVFDTLLLRDNSSELTRFVEIGARMAACARQVTPIDAFLARYLGTKASYRAGERLQGCREGSLTEILRTAARLLGQGDNFAEAFIATELDYETERLQVNPLLLDYVRLHRDRGGTAILLSDMYMHAAQIECLVDKMGVEPKLFERIFSSADTKVSKASGGIFRVVEEALRTGPRNFFHVGDRLIGDFQKPVGHGWKALHLPVPRYVTEARRQDHLTTAEKLIRDYGFFLDIAMPQ